MPSVLNNMRRVKYLLHMVNIFVTFSGVFVLTAAVQHLLVFKPFRVFLEWYYFGPAQILLVAGVIAILVAIYGFAQVVVEKSVIITKVYCVMILNVATLEFIAGIMGFILCTRISDNIKIIMINTLRNYTDDGYVQKSWNITQKNLHCCGVVDAYDWASQHIVGGRMITRHGETFSVPLSCCKNYPFCQEIFERGCYYVLKNKVVDLNLEIGYSGIFVCLIMIVGAIAGFMAVKAIRSIIETDEAEEFRRQENESKLCEPLSSESNSSIATSVSTLCEPSTQSKPLTQCEPSTLCQPSTSYS